MHSDLRSLALVTCGLLAAGLGFAAAAPNERIAPKPPVPAPVKPFTTQGNATVVDVPGWLPEQTPADFLDGIGSRVKARWRQLYRPGPGAPSSSREISAFTLGGLVADGFIALQANDAQQVRNNNQDILGYCRVLGLADKVTPRLMAQGKLAEDGKWPDLRQEVVDGHQELNRLLVEQHDEDLAVLVDLGIWLRLLHVVSGVVAEAPQKEVWPLAIGAPALLKDLKSRYDQMRATTRALERIADIDEALEFLCRHWVDAPAPDNVTRPQKSHQKLDVLLRRLAPR